jgi:hypothetical protein
MSEDSLGKVETGLRKGTRLIAAFFAASAVAYFAIYYGYSTVEPAFSVWWAVGYLAVAIPPLGALLWYQARRVNPRVLAFVQNLSPRLRDAVYLPKGMRMRGLLLSFDNGLVMNVQQNSVAFRLFLAADGTIIKPTLEGVSALLRTYRGAKRRGVASSRKGDATMKAELDRVRGLLGSRWGFVSLFEKPTSGASNPTEGKWTSLGLFFTPKWVQRGESVRNAVDDVARLLEHARTGLALG